MIVFIDCLFIVLILVSIITSFKIRIRSQFYLLSTLTVILFGLLHYTFFLFNLEPSMDNLGIGLISLTYYVALILIYIISAVVYALKNPPAGPVSQDARLNIIKAYSLISLVSISLFFIALFTNNYRDYLAIGLTFILAAIVIGLILSLLLKRPKSNTAFVFLNLTMLIVIWVGCLAIEIMFF